MTHVYLKIEDGCLQAVYADDPSVVVYLYDFDNIACEEDEDVAVQEEAEWETIEQTEHCVW